MPAMPRKDSSKPDPFAELNLTVDTTVEDSSEENSEQSEKHTAPVNDSVVEVAAPATADEDAPPVQLCFDPAFAVDDRVPEVVVSVAASGLHTFPVDGTPVEVEARVAELLVQSPAVKEVE